MSRVEDEEDEADIPPPPFNMDKLYEYFNENAVPFSKWKAEESLIGRFDDLHLPMPLYPQTASALWTGAMLIMWQDKHDPDKLGYAIHKKLN